MPYHYEIEFPTNAGNEYIKIILGATVTVIYLDRRRNYGGGDNQETFQVFQIKFEQCPTWSI